MAKNELLIIDGTALLFKMYFVKFNQHSRSGVEVGGVVGVSRAIVKLISQHNCRYVAVVFDAGSKTFRNDILSTYKGNRPPPPDDLIPQFDLVVEAVQHLGCQTFKQLGFEADDIIATLVHQASLANLPVTMVTDDKDVMGLISDENPKCQQWLYTKKEMMNAVNVFGKFGVYPSQMVDYLSLLGDTSDNVPGVKGIGAKSAVTILQHFGNLETVYNSLDEVAGLKIRGAASVQQKLQAGKDTAFLAKKLIALRKDVPIGNVEWSDLLFGGAKETAYPFFFELGSTYFLNWLDEYMEN
jgi:DNA polymerase-1